MPFELWLAQFGETTRARRMWHAQCAVAVESFPAPSSRRSLDVLSIVARVPNSVFAMGGMGVSSPMKRSATEPAFSSLKSHVGNLDAAAAIRLPLRPAAP